jgi:hypothetical protein
MNAHSPSVESANRGSRSSTVEGPRPATSGPSPLQTGNAHLSLAVPDRETVHVFGGHVSVEGPTQKGEDLVARTRWSEAQNLGHLRGVDGERDLLRDRCGRNAYLSIEKARSELDWTQASGWMRQVAASDSDHTKSVSRAELTRQSLARNDGTGNRQRGDGCRVHGSHRPRQL